MKWPKGIGNDKRETLADKKQFLLTLTPCISVNNFLWGSLKSMIYFRSKMIFNIHKDFIISFIGIYLLDFIKLQLSKTNV